MSSGRILIADDEPSVRDSVGYALTQEGFDVTPVADGDEATAELGEGIPFDLLILDIMMPGPSGLDICRGAMVLQLDEFRQLLPRLRRIARGRRGENLHECRLILRERMR